MWKGCKMERIVNYLGLLQKDQSNASKDCKSQWTGDTEISSSTAWRLSPIAQSIVTAVHANNSSSTCNCPLHANSGIRSASGTRIWVPSAHGASLGVSRSSYISCTQNKSKQNEGKSIRKEQPWLLTRLIRTRQIWQQNRSQKHRGHINLKMVE